MSARLWAWAAVAAGLVAAAAWLAWCAWLAGPWGFARPLPAPPARTADLVLSADEVEAVVVVSGTSRQFGPPAQATAIVVFVRGPRRGRRPAWVADCRPGGEIAIGAELVAWQAGGAALADRLAEALCRDHPLLRPAPGGAA